MAGSSVDCVLRRPSPCHIFLTGQPSIGKTTLVKAVVNSILRGGDDGGVPRQDGEEPTRRPRVRLGGLYTEESRGSDGRRDGFDLVCLDGEREAAAGGGGGDASYSAIATRTTLSRAQPGATKGAPFVGRYLVDVDSVDRHGAASLRRVAERLRERSSTRDDDARTVCVLDEVGKMELLCPSFLPAVRGVMDAIGERNARATRGSDCLLLGTIPTPRYGRVISAVEDIRSRDDVFVLHVTKSNRDELRTKLLTLVEKWIREGEETPAAEINFEDELSEYAYRRPIGSGSMNPSVKKGATNSTKRSAATGVEGSVACGPLVHDTIEPKVLLLGHTASPEPQDPSLAYCERSMWKVLARIHGLSHEMNDATSATEAQAERYRVLVSRVLRSGVCIWDVLADVHAKGPARPRRGGKRKSRGDVTPNDLPLFLKKHGSIQTVSFIGTKAHKEFTKQFGKDSLSRYETVILPSSSPANSRMTLEEKAQKWRAICGE